MNKKVLRFGIFVLLSLPKTIYFNFKSFDMKTAIKLPVIVGYNVKILETHKNIIKFSEKCRKIRFGMVLEALEELFLIEEVKYAWRRVNYFSMVKCILAKALR